MASTMTGKTALVTGGGSGIGRATALSFAEQGAAIVIGDMDAAAGNKTVELVEKAGGRAIHVSCDVSKEEDVKAMVEAALRAFGRLDFACNSAGTHEPVPPPPLPEFDMGLWQRIIDVDLKGVMLSMKYEIPPMLGQGSGVVVNVSSLAGLLQDPGCYAYTASKHGVVGLTKVAALAYAKAGIRVNAICPAIIETPMVLGSATPEYLKFAAATHPVGRFGKAEEVAGAVMWLCSDLAGFVTGSSVVIDGGVSVI
jgi:NAD(P)-dependent dehydrogenase (short-subunit alcohol dehydrogenase family)